MCQHFFCVLFMPFLAPMCQNIDNMEPHDAHPQDNIQLNLFDSWSCWIEK